MKLGKWVLVLGGISLGALQCAALPVVSLAAALETEMKLAIRGEPEAENDGPSPTDPGKVEPK